MALGEKYRVNIDHQFGGDSRYFSIYKEGYGGSVSELTAGQTPAIVEHPGSDNSVLDPVFGSEVEIQLISLTDEQFIEFATARNKEYMGKMYNDTSSQVEWQGWLYPAEYEESYNQPPYETSLIFNCGLGLLSNYDYLDTDGSYFTGRDTEVNILTNILQKIYPTTLSTTHRPNIRIAMSLIETSMTTAMTSMAMSLAYIDQNKYINDDGTVWTCMEVMTEILESYQSRIMMSLLGWWIWRIRDYSLLYTSYDMPYQLYNYNGTYGGYGSVDYTSTMIQTITGPQARTTMVGWVEGTQRIRHERAYRLIQLVQDYLYGNMIQMGDFQSENWDQFWNTSGTPVRAPDPQDAEKYCIKITGIQDIDQTISYLDTTVVPDQRLVFSFEAMVEYPDTNTHTLYRFDIKFRYWRSATNYYLDGQIGGTADTAHWVLTTLHTFYFTSESGAIPSGQWQRFSINIPKLPSDLDLEITMGNGLATGGSGSIDAVYYKNVKLFGTYDLEEMEKNNTIIQNISVDNILAMVDKQISIGDIDLDSNEGKYWKGAKTRDANGILPTVEWRSSRRNSTVRAYVGPPMTLAEYIVDSIMVQHGAIRRRLSGRMNWTDRSYAYHVVKVDGILYMPTQLAIDHKRGEVDVSMVEIPDIDGIGENLITGWTNDTFFLWNSTGDLITASVAIGAGEESNANSISYEADEKFLLEVEADTLTALTMEVVFAGTTVAIVDGTSAIITAPGSAGSSAPLLESQVSNTTNNLRITIKRAYGY